VQKLVFEVAPEPAKLQFDTDEGDNDKGKQTGDGSSSSGEEGSTGTTTGPFVNVFPKASPELITQKRAEIDSVSTLHADGKDEDGNHDPGSLCLRTKPPCSVSNIQNPDESKCSMERIKPCGFYQKTGIHRRLLNGNNFCDQENGFVDPYRNFRNGVQYVVQFDGARLGMPKKYPPFDEALHLEEGPTTENLGRCERTELTKCENVCYEILMYAGECWGDAQVILSGTNNLNTREEAFAAGLNYDCMGTCGASSPGCPEDLVDLNGDGSGAAYAADCLRHRVCHYIYEEGKHKAEGGQFDEAASLDCGDEFADAADDKAKAGGLGGLFSLVGRLRGAGQQGAAAEGGSAVGGEKAKKTGAMGKTKEGSAAGATYSATATKTCSAGYAARYGSHRLLCNKGAKDGMHECDAVNEMSEGIKQLTEDDEALLQAMIPAEEPAETNEGAETSSSDADGAATDAATTTAAEEITTLPPTTTVPPGPTITVIAAEKTTAAPTTTSAPGFLEKKFGEVMKKTYKALTESHPVVNKTVQWLRGDLGRGIEGYSEKYGHGKYSMKRSPSR